MNEKTWLEKNRTYNQVDETQLKSIFYFSLIWNIYEKELCHKFGKISKHPYQHSQKYAEKIDLNILDGSFEYFKHRYVLDGQPSNPYMSFEFNSEPIKHEVFECLSGSSQSKEQKLKALLCIAFRLRNNLFHGEKDVDSLYEQNKNFKQINLLLMALIDSSSIVSRNQAFDELTAISQELGMGY